MESGVHQSPCILDKWRTSPDSERKARWWLELHQERRMCVPGRLARKMRMLFNNVIYFLFPRCDYYDYQEVCETTIKEAWDALKVNAYRDAGTDISRSGFCDPYEVRCNLHKLMRQIRSHQEGRGSSPTGATVLRLTGSNSDTIMGIFFFTTVFLIPYAVDPSIE
eukprot:scaffold2838_cov112-Cylindrotheca_fusiformis.AAC.5